MADPRPALQLVAPSDARTHPDRAVLDRITDPVSRSVYRVHVELMEETGRDSTLPRSMWIEDEEER